MKTTLKHAALAGVLGTLPFFVAAHGGKKDDDEAEKIDYSSAEQHPFGRASNPAKAKRTITVGMSDQMRFTPDKLEVSRGDTVRFVIKNGGKINHEMVLGTNDTLNKHSVVMKKFPGMEHQEPYMAHVDPGKEYVMGWEFTEAGTFAFGCLIPGHFDAGMKGTIAVR